MSTWKRTLSSALPHLAGHLLVALVLMLLASVLRDQLVSAPSAGTNRITLLTLGAGALLLLFVAGRRLRDVHWIIVRKDVKEILVRLWLVPDEKKDVLRFHRAYQRLDDEGREIFQTLLRDHTRTGEDEVNLELVETALALSTKKGKGERTRKAGASQDLKVTLLSQGVQTAETLRSGLVAAGLALILASSVTPWVYQQFEPHPDGTGIVQASDSEYDLIVELPNGKMATVDGDADGHEPGSVIPLHRSSWDALQDSDSVVEAVGASLSFGAITTVVGMFFLGLIGSFLPGLVRIMDRAAENLEERQGVTA